MTKLNIAKNLPLPNEVVTQKVAWLGVTGSGKTYGATKLAEGFFHIGAQFVVLDPVGVWWGLRLAKDGKKPSSINIPIFGGLHGDIPLEPTAGALIADLIVDKGLSCILDVSQFESDTDKSRFATDFANRFFFRKKAMPSAVHLFLEECQEFVPQNPQRGEEHMLHAFIRMQKLGRNFGIGSSYITQRPQEVNKKALNMAQTLFVFRTTGTHERAAIEKWIEDKSLDESIANDLPKIETGSCHVWSPEFLKISDMVHILEKETFNASATPEVGAVAKARQLAPIDLEKVRSDMVATIEKAKSEDPKELQKKILRLETELKRTPQNFVKSNPEATEKAIKQAVLENNKEWQRKYNELYRLASDMVRSLTKIQSLIPGGIATILDQVFSLASIKPAPFFLPKNGARHVEINKHVPDPLPIEESDVKLGLCAKKIYSFLYENEGRDFTKIQLGVVTGYSPTSGGFNNALSQLNTMELIHRHGDHIGLKNKVEEYLVASEKYTPEIWFSKLGKCEREVFKLLWDNPQTIYSKEEVGIKTNYSPTSGGFNNAISHLSSIGLINRIDGGVMLNEGLMHL